MFVKYFENFCILVRLYLLITLQYVTLYSCGTVYIFEVLDLAFAPQNMLFYLYCSIHLH